MGGEVDQSILYRYINPPNTHETHQVLFEKGWRNKGDKGT
jgi:hypothetical protein